MQQLNVLPVSVSQGADLKAESQTADSRRSDGDNSFSLLVEQHVADKPDDHNVTKTHTNKEKNSRDIQISKKEEVTNEPSVIAAKDVATSDNSVENDAENVIEEQLETSEQVLLNNDAENKDAVDLTKNISLVESQKFISLLYTADKTLVNKVEQPVLESVTTTDELIDSELDELVSNGEGQKKVTNKSVGAVLTSHHEIANDALKSDVLKSDKTKVAQVNEKSLTDAEKLLMTNKALDHAIKLETTTNESKSIIEKSLTPALAQQSKESEIINKTKLDKNIMNSVVDEAEVTGSTFIKSSEVDKEKLASLGSAVVDLKNNSSMKSEAKLQPILATDEIIDKSSKQLLGDHINNKLSIESDEQNVSSVLARKTNNTLLTNELDEVSVPVTPKSQTNIKSEFERSLSQNTQTVDHINRPLNSQTAEQQLAHQIKTMSQEEKNIKLELESDLQTVDEAELGKGKEELNFASNDVNLKIKETPITVNMNKADGYNGTRLYTDIVSNTTQVNDSYALQQSAELLSYNVASDTAQIQKNNVLLQQETISIFRKDFVDALKDKVMLVISQKLQQFDITLDPPELGNMQVKVNMQGEQAVVNFIVQNQQAKDALEQNMHKLRDMLSEQGVDVGDANVEQQANQSFNENSDSNNNSDQTLMSEDELTQSQTLLSAQSLNNNSANVVDYYA